MGENTAVGGNIGKPVSASDGDSDVLIYSLIDTPDLEDVENKARFTIDPSSGQIKVGQEAGCRCSRIWYYNRGAGRRIDLSDW